MTKKREGRSCKKAFLGVTVTDLVAAANLVLAFSYSFWTDFTKSTPVAFKQAQWVQVCSFTGEIPDKKLVLF